MWICTGRGVVSCTLVGNLYWYPGREGKGYLVGGKAVKRN